MFTIVCCLIETLLSFKLTNDICYIRSVVYHHHFFINMTIWGGGGGVHGSEQISGTKVHSPTLLAFKNVTSTLEWPPCQTGEGTGIINGAM